MSNAASKSATAAAAAAAATNTCINSGGSNNITNTESTEKASKRMSGYCDICQMKDGFRGMMMLKCQDCRVTVHDECYAVPKSQERIPNPKFRCWACQATGKAVKVREKDDTGKRLVVVQESRPRECCLCSVKDGIHAMYPMYDSHGKEGRHILLPPDDDEETTTGTTTRKLAWSHALCAQAVCRNIVTAGCVHGCELDGYAGFEDTDDGDQWDIVPDDESVNSDLDVENPAPGDMGIHHFVYWGFLSRLLGGTGDKWTRNMDESRQGAPCIFCGADDKKTVRLGRHGTQVYQTLRFCIQCTGRNQSEYKEFYNYHEPDDPCYQKLHVGCAMWGRNKDQEYSLARRCWYFPGRDTDNEEEKETIAEVYCDAHAHDILRAKGKCASMKRKLPGPFAPVPVTSSTKRRRTESHLALSPLRDSRGNLVYEPDDVVRTTSIRPIGLARTSSTAPGNQWHRAAHSGGIPKKAAIGQRAFKKGNTDELVQKVLDDLREKRRECMQVGRRFDKKVTSPVKARWKRDSSLPVDQFDAVWKNVKTIFTAEVNAKNQSGARMSEKHNRDDDDDEGENTF